MGARKAKDEGETKGQLIADLVEARQRIAELEATQTGRKRAERQLILDTAPRRVSDGEH